MSSPVGGVRSWLVAARSDEDGASLALVALSLVWIIGLASLVVDIGQGWLSRQALIPATDAAALAAAQDLVHRPWDEGGACSTAGAYVVDNAPEAAMTECSVISLAAGGGRVSVTAIENFEAILSDVTTEAQSIQSVSTAAWGSPLTVSALRPFGLCYDGSAELRQLIDNPPGGPSWVRVDYTKDETDACGGVQSLGNFATVDFDGGTGLPEIRSWMLDGYPGQVSLDPVEVTNCDAAVGCFDRPYASNDIRGEVQSVRNSQAYVAFPLFDYADAEQVHLIGMVRARLYDFQLSGSPETWWIELKVDPGLVAGTCCGPPGVLAGNQVIAICGVDQAAFQACQPSNGP